MHTFTEYKSRWERMVEYSTKQGNFRLGSGKKSYGNTVLGSEHNSWGFLLSFFEPSQLPGDYSLVQQRCATRLNQSQNHFSFQGGTHLSLGGEKRLVCVLLRDTQVSRLLNPHSAEQNHQRAWVRCSYPLGHDSLQCTPGHDTLILPYKLNMPWWGRYPLNAPSSLQSSS